MADTLGRDTVSIYFVNAALRKLSAESRTRVLRGLDIPAAWLEVPNARIQSSTFSALWLAVARELDDEFFGLDRRAMKVGSFAMLCHAVVHCENLDRALKRMLRYYGLLLDDIRADLHLDGDEAEIRVHCSIQDPVAKRFAEETLLVLVHGLICWLIGGRVALTRVSFGGERPAHAEEHTRMFSEHVRYGASGTSIRFKAQALASSLVQSPTSLRQFLKSAPQSVFLKYKNEDSWSAKVRRFMRPSLHSGDWPQLEEVAREFAMTTTTLRRRLDAEGSSYQAIKDQLRSDWAIDRLSNSSATVDEIAVHLGFHDSSAFHRAFRRWNGLQPGEYRRRRLQAGAPLLPA